MNDMNWKTLQNGSDIRGVAIASIPEEPVNLTPEIACRIGQSFVLWLCETLGKSAAELTVALGRDSRLSGPELMAAMTAGMASLGVKVYDFGLASTPAMFVCTIIADEEYRADGAIMLTASHLPSNRNGCKFFTRHGGLDKQNIRDILAIAAEREFTPASTSGAILEKDFIRIYASQLVDTIRKGVNHANNYERPLEGLKIIVDAGNGAGGFYASKVLQPLGADTTGSQFLDPDGNFPNHVPNPENEEAMASICQAVVDNKADFGIIFDTDVDRGCAVDSSGAELNRNRLIALISAIILRENPGSAIVTDSITSDGLNQFITAELQGIHHRFKRGYKNVINEAKRLNETGNDCWLAIETSGHAALKENYFLDDGAYLVSKLVIELANAKLEGRSLTDLIANLQEPVESQEFRIKLTLDNFKDYGNEVIEKLKNFAESQPDWQVVPNNYEGVRISCTAPEENGWFLLRLSLHDPVLPLNVESNVTGGVQAIGTRLHDFLRSFTELNLTSLVKSMSTEE